MSVQLEEQLALERSMRLGLENGEFFLHYQPQVDLVTGYIVGLEALVRWNHAEKGLISPVNFIPLSEETGFILPLGEWVLRQACQQAKYWSTIYSRPLKVAVNISARQFHNENLASIVNQVLQEYELDPKYLELEITESTFMRNVDKAVTTLKKIKDLGICVALDDFGTGYSSLAYLRTFKTDYLKIDQSFVREIPHNKDDMEIVGAIIAMASKLSLKTIAEGVETQDQYRFLKEQGCDIGQGYFISKPVMPDAITSLLKESST
jgi:EAL domain-containing protein (putative c-di-GMP-specific phosphodiesterase class I)